MDRRSFLKKSALIGGTALAMPYILPSGRLFAATGNRKVNHVVFCLFAGGVRNMESVHQNESNLMSNLLKDIGGGFSPQAGINENMPASPLGGERLQSKGTLIKEMRFKEGPTGHYNGHVTALTGRYNDTNLNLRANPPYPTIFEYYRKHLSNSSALNSWWISDSLGPYPLLNYSSHPNYGAQYGANYIQATGMVSGNGYNAIGNPQEFSNAQKDLAQEIRSFCDGNFQTNLDEQVLNILNTAEEKAELKAFIDELFQREISGADYLNWGFNNVNNDLRNIYYAEQVLQKFQPELTVLNMQNVDICHSDFTNYCNLLRRADWGVAHLWNTIQSTPGLADDTVLIVAPEHGRNLQPNTLLDAYGRPAYDHTNDQTSREVFCMICGPDHVVQQDQVIDQVYGESIDIVPTIADLLGFNHEIPGGMLPGNVLTDALHA